MSNLYRSNPNGESNYRIINSNAMMDEIIQAHLAEEEERKKKNGAFAPVSFEEVEEGEDMERDTSMDALFMDGEEIREGDDGESLEQANADAEAILEEARQQADGILADAEANAAQIAEAARREAESAGYEEGLQRAQAEIDQKKAELDGILEQERQKLAIERAQMESELVDIILDVFESVFAVEFADKKEILLYLIQNAMQGIEGAKHFVIKIPPERMRELEGFREEILSGFPADISLDIVADSSLHDLDCVLETENGVFECGPLVQLENLVKDMRILANTAQ